MDGGWGGTEGGDWGQFTASSPMEKMQYTFIVVDDVDKSRDPWEEE